MRWEDEQEMWCRMRRCSLVEKKVKDVVASVINGHVLHLLLLQRKAPGVFRRGGGLRCLALTRMSRRLLQRR